jgi:hypothetical protein
MPKPCGQIALNRLMIDLFSLLGFPSFALISLFELFEQRGKRHFFCFRMHLFEICYPFFKSSLSYFPIRGSEAVFFAFAVNFLLGIIISLTLKIADKLVSVRDYKRFGGIAQLVERLVRNEKARGSNPLTSNFRVFQKGLVTMPTK